MPKDKNIHDMKLHDMIAFDMIQDGSDDVVKESLIVARVPGGWMYIGGTDRSACFVPYSDEFRTGNFRGRTY